MITQQRHINQLISHKLSNYQDFADEYGYGGHVGTCLDVKGAFLRGEFGDGEVIHMNVLQGFEKHFPEGSVLLLKKCLYGLKQAAKTGDSCCVLQVS